jgi:hypothetical protein
MADHNQSMESVLADIRLQNAARKGELYSHLDYPPEDRVEGHVDLLLEYAGNLRDLLKQALPHLPPDLRADCEDLLR